MKMRLLVLGVILYSFFPAFGQSTELSDNGFDDLRIENEIKLAVPNAIADSVWQYLRTRYDNDNLFLKDFDNAFSTKAAEDLFVDRYYDNEQMQLLKQQLSVRHRTRYVLTDTTDIKHGLELLQIKTNDIGNNELNRGEFKYEIKYYGGKPDNAIDGHPFFYNVAKAQREALAERLYQYGIDAFDLFPTIKIEQLRKRIYVSLEYQPFATMTLDFVTASFGGKSGRFTELELELNELNYTRADSATKARMEEINALIKKDLLTAFPSIQQDQTPKYNKAFMALGLKDFSYRPAFGLSEKQISVGLLLILILGLCIFHWLNRKAVKKDMQDAEQIPWRQTA
jgi:hypothetical protein